MSNGRVVRRSPRKPARHATSRRGWQGPGNYRRRDLGRERLFVANAAEGADGWAVPRTPRLWPRRPGSFVPTVSRVIPSSTGLIGLGEVKVAKWDNAARATAADLKRLAEAVEAGLEGFGIDQVEGFAARFDSVGRIIDANKKSPDG